MLDLSLLTIGIKGFVGDFQFKCDLRKKVEWVLLHSVE